MIDFVDALCFSFRVNSNHGLIYCTVNSINVRMKKLDTNVTHIETRVTEVENSCSFINDSR